MKLIKQLIKRLLLLSLYVFLSIIASILVFNSGYENLGMLVLIGGLGCSIYLAFKPSKPKEKQMSRHAPTPQVSKGMESPDFKADSDLTFTIKLNDQVVDDYSFPRKNKDQLKFVDHETTVEIAGFHITGPVYIGSMKNSSGHTAPSVIDTSLKVKRDGLAEPLGYWPSYKDLNPEQRGIYLKWLDEGKGDVDDLGYAFIYFYGMERYVFIDAKTDNQTDKAKRLDFIVHELKRLQQLFCDNRSFQGYANNLLDAIFIKYFPDQISDRKTNFPEKNPLAAQFIVARYANEGITEPIDSDWALHWLFAGGELKRTKTAREQYPLLRMVFKNLYDSAGGLIVPTNKTKLSLAYQPASSGLHNEALIKTPKQWCDPMALKRPVKTLAKISENLMPMVRKVAKALASGNSLEILTAWPLDLRDDPPAKLTELIKQINDFCRDNPSSLISSLGNLFGMELNDKISKAQLTKLSDGLGACGWVMVPDPRISAVGSLSTSDHLFLYQGTRPEALSPDGQALDIKIRMAALLARSDGDVHAHEAELISSYVNEHKNSLERDYLRHYANWRLAFKTSAAGLKAQIDTLTVKNRDDLAKILVEVAHADGCLPKQEIKELEKLFTKIGLEKSLVARYLHESSHESPTSMQSPGPDPTETVANPANTLSLDVESLKAHAESTKEIQSVLNQIFEDETEPASVENTPSEGFADIWHKGALDDKLNTLMEWLVTKEEWPRIDVESQCAKMGLMIDGALESINEVAFDQLGDSLLEIDDPIVIYHDVLPA